MKKYNLKINGNSYAVHITDADQNKIQMQVNGTSYEVELEKEIKTTKTPRLVRSQPSAPVAKATKPLQTSTSVKKITAPLPGTVLKICVNVGDTIKTGDELIVLEAMKMENIIQAESSGTIKSIQVQANANVLQGDILLEIG
ncbi:biotin/lipoyl-containing protein [Neptunitalea lumnitzerae]|uniref:Acetyl-CoA carboxylase biotin carboxyl carrier protein subunit n=1 Tax=Neptunitalea lumnitzerae TaxID=2965509 RepID=A0ABQ5MIT6_9FLAO|nr:acetyl-CoA carboxylase biotin carboxyl carrier protein subunit [Neptunitalea sp. Y10]GLB49320.1 acetyl-CoA carboxylase biotin carboxyl carrier protein subunit [Neptunitalea sp. Y10]